MPNQLISFLKNRPTVLDKFRKQSLVYRGGGGSSRKSVIQRVKENLRPKKLFPFGVSPVLNRLAFFAPVLGTGTMGTLTLGGRIASGAKTAYRKTAEMLWGGGFTGRLKKAVGISYGVQLFAHTINPDIGILPGKKFIERTLSYGLGGPISVIAGLAYGVSTQSTKKITDLIKSYTIPDAIPFINYTPDIPTPSQIIGDVKNPLGNFANYVTAPAPQINITEGAGPSLVVSSGGGGGLDPSMLLWLVGIGLGGYALGRRKRKKRKYKKRRNR